MQIDTFFNSYINRLHCALEQIDVKALSDAKELITNTAKNNQKIFVCGNGGSAAISEHLCCDHSKGVFYNTKLKHRVHSLVSNISMVTALANDIDYNSVFSEQLKMYADAGDLLIVISSSGNSQNIIQALNVAKTLGMSTIAFTGFAGGVARNSCDVSIHVESNNYGISEDCHQIIMHILAQSISMDKPVDINSVRL